MIGRGLSGSAIKYVHALSPLAHGATGCTNPVWFGDFSHVTLLVLSGSLSDADAQVHVQRSATSNGTFVEFGASVAASAAGQLYARSWPNEGSAGWYKVKYAPGAGSDTLGIVLVGQGAQKAPIDQHVSTTVLSDVVL